MSLQAKFELWLIAAYLYYEEDKTIMSDYEWDLLGRELFKAWNDFEHPHKKLVDAEHDLCSGHYIKWPEDIVKRARQRTDAVM